MYSSVLLEAVLLTYAGLVVRASDEDASLRFYKRSFDKFVEVPLLAGQDVVKTDWYERDKPTVFFAHGFTGKPEGPAVTSVVGAYLATGAYNVVLLNWQKLAAQRVPSMASSYVTWASPNARKLGAVFADALESMLGAGLRLNSTRLVGHSLGAQLFGIAGAKLAAKGVILPWITGLDPASIGYEGSAPGANLNARSAAFVDVVHSDPSKYGYRRPHGTVDYWPNYSGRGPVRQPGCESGAFAMFSPGDLCSHNRSWQLLVDALQRPGTLLASYAKNYRAWKNRDESAGRETLALGELPARPAHGDYYLTTNDQPPYGRGNDGI